MSKLRLMLLGTAAFGLVAAAMSTASAGEVEKTAGFSGHVNRAVTAGSNGNEGFVRHVDNYASSSRFRGTVKAASEAMTIGATLEVGAYIDRSTTIAQNATSQGSTVAMRQSNISISNNMGKLTIGRAWASNDTASDIDVSGTDQVTAGGAGAFHAITFYNTQTRANSGVSVGSQFDTYKTFGLSTIAEYTTPDFNGFSASIRHQEQGSGSAGISYAADYDGTAITFGTGIGNVAGDTVDRRWGAGLGVVFANGLNLSLGYGKDNVNNNASTGGTASLEDSTAAHVILGYKMTGLTNAGGTNFAIQYAQIDDSDATASNADDLRVISVRVQQSLDDYGTTVYGGYERFDYDTNLGNFDTVNGGVVGIKVTF